MTINIKTLVGAAAALVMSFAASSAHAVTVSPFSTPLNPGDNTNGLAQATAFEDFGMTTLLTTAADDLIAEVSVTINPFMTDLAGTPTNSIDIAYSINGGSAIALNIITVGTPVGTIGAAGVEFALFAGDTVSFFVTGVAGQSGNLVTFVVETMSPSEVPLPAALPLFMAGIAGLGYARRRKATGA